MSKKILLSLTSLIVFSSSVFAEEFHRIVNSKLSSIDLRVPAGEKIKISNSDICLEKQNSPCQIILEKDAVAKIVNSNLGRRLIIIADKNSKVSPIKLSNTHFPGKLERAENSQVASFPSGELTELKIVNSDMNYYSYAPLGGESLRLSNVKLCTNEGEEDCKISPQAGSALDFTNVVLGERVVIDSNPTELIRLSLSNTDFYGTFGTSALPRSAPQKANTKQKVEIENERLQAKLEKENIPVKTTERGLVVSLPDIFFEFDRSELTLEARRNVDRITDILAEADESRVLSIEGHTDSIGSHSYNKNLSERRAGSVASRLQRNGLADTRLTVRAYGETKPVASNETDLGRAKNRRVEIILENEPARARLSGNESSLTADLNRQAQSRAVPRTRTRDSSRNSRPSSRSSEGSRELNAAGISIQKNGDDVSLSGPGFSITKQNGRVALEGPGISIEGPE